VEIFDGQITSISGRISGQTIIIRL
jgi:hypothetical protein